MFDVNAARKSGYSDSEILDHLTQTRNFDVEGAKKTGYSESEIIDHLSSVGETIKPSPTGLFGKLTSGLSESQRQYEEMAMRTREDISKIPVIGPGLVKMATSPKIGEAVEPIGMLLGAEQAGQLIGKGGEAGINLLKKGYKYIQGKPSIGKTPAALLEKVGGELKPSLAGQTAKEWMQIGSKEAEEMGGGLFDAVRAEAKGIKLINYENTLKTVEEIPLSRDYKMLSPPDKGHIDNIIRTVKGETSTPVGVVRGKQFSGQQLTDFEAKITEQFGIPQPPESSFETAIGLEKGLGRQSWELRKTERGRLVRKIRDSVFKDMERAAQDANKPDLVDQLRDANKFYSENVFGEGKGKIIERFQKMSPEKLVDKLRTGTIGDIQNIKEMAGIEGTQSLKQGYVTDLIKRNENNPIKIGKEVRNSLSKRSEEMSQIFNKDELEIMQNIGNPSKLRVFMEEHPKTAWLGRILIRASVYGGLGYGVLRHRFPWEH